MLGLAGRSVIAALVLTAVLGFAYPGAISGIARLAFPEKSNGSIVEVNGRAVGSRLAAQAFAGPGYFRPRPSATDYDAAGTSFANLGPTNAELLALVRKRARAILALERPYNPRLEIGDIPVDAVTTSGSGIDPHISRADAELQAARVTEVRRLSRARVEAFIEAAADGRSLRFFGEPGVNVLELNLLLDQVQR